MIILDPVAASDQLTTIDSFKEYASVTTADNDALLNVLIEAVSERIRRLCGRHFNAADYIERHSAYGDRDIILNQYPVLSVKRVSIGNDLAFTISHDDPSSIIKLSVNVNDDNMILSTSDASGTQTTDTLHFVNYPSAQALVNAINALSGWSASLVRNCMSVDINPVTISNLPIRITFPSNNVSDFTFDAETARLTPSGFSQFPMDWIDWGYINGVNGVNAVWLVEYRAGFEVIPADLEMVANQLTKRAWGVAQLSLTQASGAMNSETIGDYTYRMSGIVNRLNIEQQELAILSVYSKLGIGKRR